MPLLARRISGRRMTAEPEEPEEMGLDQESLGNISLVAVQKNLETWNCEVEGCRELYYSQG